ncbi:hypothetical protein FOY51_11305 [Antrihabitans cavernicola]|uniref:Uncharacterized protein n=1 Tax=Antrihabitans cavernicola TaxID=2495913 RepID=A0A5A7SAJ0_9NOCA|nr:hypothetical protein FOY51_11305 [Spelaeibacter cavernicola]
MALIAGALATVAIAGCGSQDNGTATSAPSSVGQKAPAASQAPTGNAGGTDNIGNEAAKKLCSDIEAQLSDWRVQGPTLGKPGLNILVQTWAAQNGLINAQIVRDRTIIDKITTDNCADTRQQAIEALNIPDLASGLVGF